MTTDVIHRDQVKTLVCAAVQTYGRIDVIINNAGLMPQSLSSGSKSTWDGVIDVNIKGVLYGIAAALPYMQRQKSGHIINVSSVADHKVGAPALRSTRRPTSVTDPDAGARIRKFDAEVAIPAESFSSGRLPSRSVNRKTSTSIKFCSGRATGNLSCNRRSEDP